MKMSEKFKEELTKELKKAEKKREIAFMRKFNERMPACCIIQTKMDFNKSWFFLGMYFDVFDRKIVDALTE